jgi:hypothetical protein
MLWATTSLTSAQRRGRRGTTHVPPKPFEVTVRSGPGYSAAIMSRQGQRWMSPLSLLAAARTPIPPSRLPRYLRIPLGDTCFNRAPSYVRGARQDRDARRIIRHRRRPHQHVDAMAPVPSRSTSLPLALRGCMLAPQPSECEVGQVRPPSPGTRVPTPDWVKETA